MITFIRKRRAGLSFVAAATYSQAGGGNAAFNLPTGTQQSDFVIIARAQDLTDAGWNTPSGYTELFNVNAGVAHQVVHRIIGAAETQATIVNPSATLKSAILMMTFRGADQTTPIDAVCAGESSGTSADPDPPSVTTATNNAIVVAFGFMDDDNITSCTGPSGYSNTTFVAADDVADSSASLMAATKLVASAGAENPSAFTTDGDDAWNGYTLAVRPA